ncbi:hypothetical protein [Nostoc favosum]|uniref:Uncharacterized protein n=1 Tax=Nostoc favosum CHAB5714 TaxID=2780399 RepID=A0ABS8I797_9NOSO|nr:hypothetical protein [Nostoc favosum]MCC5599912.1 hypothetical protein [Nostoc favosum CHAB5714]
MSLDIALRGKLAIAVQLINLRSQRNNRIVSRNNRIVSRNNRIVSRNNRIVSRNNAIAGGCIR